MPRRGAEGVVMILYSNSMFTFPLRNGNSYCYYEWTVSDRRIHEMAGGSAEACTALSLTSAAREAGFYAETSCRVLEYGKTSFVLAVYDREEGKLLARFHCSDGIETLCSLYMEELLPEPSTWRAYFERMMDWYTSPSTTL